MPLPDPRPAIVQAPVWAGIGLRFHYYDRVPMPCWPEDWWQRNYDTLLDELSGFEGICMTERMKHLPPAPEAVP